MRSFLFSKVAVPFHLAFLLAYLLCVQFSARGIGPYLPLAFLAFGLMEVALLFPSALRGEQAADARLRARMSLKRDPVFLFCVAGFLFMVLQTLNGPRTLVFNALAKVWEFSPARVRDFPACLNQLLSIQGAFWALLVGATVAAVRSMGKNARAHLLRYIAYVAGAAALYGLVRRALPSLPPAGAEFLAFPTRETAGAFFLGAFCLSAGIYTADLADPEASKWNLRFLLSATLLTFFAAVFSLSVLAACATVVAAVLLLGYGIVYGHSRVKGATRLRLFIGAIVLAGLCAFLHVVAYPKNPVHAMIDKVASLEWRSEAEVAERETLEAVAWRMFKANKPGGVGTWGYSLPTNFGLYVSRPEWKTLSNRDGRYSTCGKDGLTFLAEYGAVGTFLVFMPFVLLAFFSLCRLVIALFPKTTKPVDSTTSTENERTPFQEIVPPAAFASALAAGGIWFLSFNVSVLHHPAVLTLWTAALLVLHASLPKPTPRAERDDLSSAGRKRGGLLSRIFHKKASKPLESHS